MAQNDLVSAASSYPENLPEQTFWNCNLPGYRKRLRDESVRLFEDVTTADVGVLELHDAIQGLLRCDSCEGCSNTNQLQDLLKSMPELMSV
jgi:hypothetical protein